MEMLQLDRDEVMGRDGEAGSLGRVKVSLLVLVLVVVVVERRFTFRPQESSPYIVAA